MNYNGFHRKDHWAYGYKGELVSQWLIFNGKSHYVNKIHYLEENDFHKSFKDSFRHAIITLSSNVDRYEMETVIPSFKSLKPIIDG